MRGCCRAASCNCCARASETPRSRLRLWRSGVPGLSLESHPHVARFARAAATRGVAVEIRRFSGTTRTAVDAAREIGCALGQIVKSLVFLADGEPVLVLCAGADRVDEAKLRAHVGAASVRRATANEARRATGYPVGGTPPFGHERGLRVLIDPRLFGYEEVWSGAGLPEAVARIRSADLVRATGGEVAEVAYPCPR